MDDLLVAGFNESIGADTNGEGFSIGIFFSGCSRSPKCKQCHNPSLWKKNPHLSCPTSDIIKKVRSHGYLFTHVVLLGGEPLDQHHGELYTLISELHKAGYIVWMYTGLEESEIPPTFLATVDVIVTGPFIPELQTNGFPASANQKVIRRE